MSLTLKEQKEAFVTGHSGTTPLETFLVCLASPVGIFFFNEVRHIMISLRSVKKERTRSKSQVAHAPLVFVEYVGLLLPMAICQTSLLYPVGISLIILESFLGVLFVCFRLRTARNIRSTPVSDWNPSVKNGEEKTRTKREKLNFLTAYRSSVSYLTFVAILAVDFRVFPRRFAKTETVGYGLMDLGAGSFVIAGGLVSSSARSIGNPKQASSRSAQLLSSLTRSAPLVLLGFIRLATNKGIEYQEHASEYGVHWNFFFTLALVGLFASVIRLNNHAGTFIGLFIPVLLLSIYQLALTRNGLQDYVENAPRLCSSSHAVFCDFFAANREGLLGSVGYLVMFLCSEEIGRCCLFSSRGGEKSRGMRLLSCSVGLWVLHFFLVDLLGVPVSRRSTNSSFVLWTLAHNVSLLFLIWLAFYTATLGTNAVTEPSPIFDAVNKHGLIVFVLANLMTGLINISTDTLGAGDGKALTIIFGYLFSVGSAALLLRSF